MVDTKGMTDLFPADHVLLFKLSLTGSLVLCCDGPVGYALARYDFRMPGS